MVYVNQSEVKLVDAIVYQEEFKALLEWRMCSDPFPMEESKKHLIDDLLDGMAVDFGFGDWLEAYHAL